MTDDVDEVAVERACRGDHTVTLNRAEAAAAFRLLDTRGLSSQEIADVLGTTQRSVFRWRSGDTAPITRPGVTVDNTKEKIAVALKHENITIRRAAMRANDDLAKLNRLLADWDAQEMARERVAELEHALAEAKAALRGGKKPTAKQAGAGVHAQARAWARKQGIEVQPIGRVPQPIIDAWQRATSSAA